MVGQSEREFGACDLERAVVIGAFARLGDAADERIGARDS